MDGAAPTLASGVTRRRFLRTAGAGGATWIATLSGCAGLGDVAPSTSQETQTDAERDPTPDNITTDSMAASATADIRGAVYFPSRTFNHYQAWEMYNPGEAVTDLSLAATVHVNGLRVLVSYEFWRDHPEEFQRNLDHFLAIAANRGIHILPVMFESIGEEPTPANLHERDVLRNGAIRSPSHDVIRDKRKWDGPRRFVKWFVRRYADRDGLLAVEIMNEPGGWPVRVEFCRAMLRAARAAESEVPLTMGCKTLENNRSYDDPKLDVFQFHYNLPPTVSHMRDALSEAVRVSQETSTPVWLTEWQRTRTEPPNKMQPNYSSLASVIRESDIDGDFFWQLMLKPAYGYIQRIKGRLNGLFYEDGHVFSIEDAHAISGENGYWRSRKGWPEWARELRNPNTDNTDSLSPEPMPAHEPGAIESYD